MPLCGEVSSQPTRRVNIDILRPQAAIPGTNYGRKRWLAVIFVPRVQLSSHRRVVDVAHRGNLRSQVRPSSPPFAAVFSTLLEPNAWLRR